jgi:anti-anti-sigma regulatory factor
MRAYVEARPHSYLLTLLPTEAGAYPLATALRRALRSTRCSVWVDCRHVSALSAEALLLLRRCASRLWQHGGHLILYHLPEAARASLATTDTSQPLAASLLDAAQYGLAWPMGSSPSTGLATS